MVAVLFPVPGIGAVWVSGWFTGPSRNFADPVEQTFAVTLSNGLGVPIRGEQCDAKCDVVHEAHELASGGSGVVNTSSWGADNYWLVTRVPGGRLGCLDLLFHEKRTGVVVKTSTFGACP